MPRSRRPVAIVTGAAKGIGRAIAQHLLAADWDLCLVDLPKAGLGRIFAKHSRHAILLEGNVAEEDTAKRTVQAAIENFGRLDGLVSNAGIMIRKPIRQLTLAEWHKVIDVNVTAAFLLARAAEKPLRAAKGAIVTIASTRALMSEPNTESYSASKGGLVALTHALAISFGQQIRVNCVSPGWIETGDYGALRRMDHAQHPAGRVGRPEDIAQIVGWLLDGSKSGFVTGANFIIDGGMTRKMIYEE